MTLPALIKFHATKSISTTPNTIRAPHLPSHDEQNGVFLHQSYPSALLPQSLHSAIPYTIQNLLLPHPGPTSFLTPQNPTLARAPHHHTSPLLHETLSLQLFTFPFAVFNPFTPQNLLSLPRKDALSHGLYLAVFVRLSLHQTSLTPPQHFSTQTRSLQHSPRRLPQLESFHLFSDPTQDYGYAWFPPILDLHRAHRALHGNTPTSSKKSDPPPLVPPPSPSPPPPSRKKASTKLDYTDDISIGNPSVSSRKALHGVSSTTASASQPRSSTSIRHPSTTNSSSTFFRPRTHTTGAPTPSHTVPAAHEQHAVTQSDRTPTPPALFDELGTPITTKPRRTFFSPTVTSVPPLLPPSPPPPLPTPPHLHPASLHLPFHLVSVPHSLHLHLLPPPPNSSGCSPLYHLSTKPQNHSHNGYSTLESLFQLPT